MRLNYIVFIFIITITNIQAQQVKVLSAINEEPLSEVLIYNLDKSKNVITDLNGEASLDMFLSHEILYFQHLTHILKKLEKSQIEKVSVVYLEDNTQDLNEIVISASNFEQQKRDIPQKILSVNSKSVQFINPQTSADLLGSTGQVYIQKSQYGGGSPMIRGFSTNRLLITVDGVRMNNAIFRGGNLQNVISIDPFSIQNAEVILGSGSIIYGSDAIGGVMSFYTQKPNLSYTDSLKVTTNAIVRYATASDEKTGHLDFNIGLKRWAFLTNASYSSFSDLRMGKHGPDDYLRPEFVTRINNEDVIIQNNKPLVQRPTGYNQYNVMQKVRFEPYNSLSFNLGLYYTTTSNVPRYDRLIRYNGDNLRSSEWHYGPQQWFMANAQITKLSSLSNLYDKVKVTMAYQNFQESRVDRNFQSDIRNIREEAVDAYSFSLDLEKRLSPKTHLFYGVEYVFNKVMSHGQEENISTNTLTPTVSRYPNGSNWQSASIYSSIKYKPNAKFVFQSGLRFSHSTSNANFKENNVYLNLPFESSKNTSGALTGTVGISWSPNPILQWKFNWSSAFRAPNIDDIGKVFDSEPGSVVVPNQSLKPEYAYGGDLGLTLNFNDTFILDLSTYYTFLDNALVRRDFQLNGETNIIYDGEWSQVQAIQNAAKAWVYGFEAGLQVKFSKQLKLTSQYSVVGGTEEDDTGAETPLRHAAPNFGNTHLVYSTKAFKVDVFTNYNNELSFNQLAPSEIEKDYIYASNAQGNPFAPSWATLNLTTQYQVTNDASITASLENITDQRYKTYSSGIAAAGRNFIVSLKYSL
ncbi:MAG: TonB-dependent receptor [Flavobacteriales bacterium]|nr:TonB-dependent receptor [Flavobacteriia bacterium]NCP05366.1 TonB-dependent receptor [Flavobacteriales bacterium]PIV92555.1 MAG: TonB-dependent receptor [Flavobacteriaceae bacterium CG17_big_fil_post_rev_8_21_14_2_50_33_15]PIY12657.1 MAG: TonB-dependent receptor [Flavobacteriaceae bacterium CG_4_10_14_3_um_filter_33_47]PJB18083.1 MAG: TonB-dependent receptor [Flavobacteriaceae bacterium CG_4_9_14_3_um_filter_33_16]